MSSYKYPYIPREYYAAVMFACKMIRQNGYFNKAINTAANYYGVDADEVEYHVRARQAAGQKGTAKGRKYHYYIVCKWSEIAGDERYIHGITVEKATSSGNAIKKFSNADLKATMELDYGGSYAPLIGHSLVIDSEYESEESAQDGLEKILEELETTGKSGHLKRSEGNRGLVWDFWC